ncbi:glycosyltransferase family 9 protein [Desulfonatronovibrio hydrogenovorans]|uniref:glycosyltransferase family 9 protein n=1 Tax=Desulfonatronovibrio hydrogenovorans TaxID=53245 RepID=UPI000490AC1E|nr:glycosyltransferase family 9 protein [Desulfonatronovibrio hydrogenovorans]
MNQPCPRKALILNLTRFGDLIQSQPVLTWLKKQGYTTHLVCLENFAAAARLLKDADYIRPLPGAKILALTDASWIKAVAELERWAQGMISSQKFDVAVNLTPSVSSRLLTSLVRSGELRGFFLDEMGYGCYSGNWAAFLQASSAHRGCSPFNVTDMFVRAAHLSPDRIRLRVKKPDPGLVNAMAENLARASGSRSFSGYMAFQLGASDSRRRWPVKNFARLGDRLVKELNICPVLLGSENEQDLGRRYQDLSKQSLVNLIGRTDLDELSAALVCTGLLVTNDTGTLHLAAGLGIKSISFFLATAQPWDTGPYLDGCLCLEPEIKCHPCSFSHQCQNDLACRQTISADLVFRILNRFRLEKKWPCLATDQARIRETSIKDGWFRLKPMNDSAWNDYSRWMAVQSHFYRLFLDGHPLTFPDQTMRPGPDFCQEVTTRISELLPLLNLAMEQASVLKKTAVSLLKKRFLTTWQKLSRELAQSPHFPVLGMLWTYQSQAASTDLDQIADLCRAYHLLLENMQSFLNHS